ncbi:hypothetical protein ACVWYF_001965 [Hymenobacter sp. UYAg731]
MKKKYCEHGHLLAGDTCSHCAQHPNPAAGGAATVAPAANRTLVELRDLKNRLQKGLITEVEYDEGRNSILANF